MRRGSWMLTVGLLAVLPLVGATPLAGVASADQPAPAGRATVEAVQLAQRRGLSLEEATRRLDRQQRAHALDEELRSALGDGYGGMWIDQANGGRLKVGVRSGAGAVGDRVARHGLAGISDLVTVDHGVEDLERAADEIGKALVRLNRNASWPLRSGMATPRNAVELALPEGRPLSAAQRTFVEQLRRRYRDAVRLTTYQHHARFARCNPPNCDPPLRGGVHMYVPGFDGTSCTAGFMARGRTTSSHRYVLTAGHCMEDQPGGDRAWYARFANGEGHKLGTPPMVYAVVNERGDAGIIPVENPGPSGWNVRPWVYTTYFNGPGKLVYPQEDYVIQRVGRSSEILGEQVCKTGQVTGTTCGELTSYGATLEVVSQGRSVTIRNMGRINGACTKLGDSGAPVFVGHVAYGIVSTLVSITGDGCGGPEGGMEVYYTGIVAAQDLTNVDVLTG